LSRRRICAGQGDGRADTDGPLRLRGRRDRHQQRQDGDEVHAVLAVSFAERLAVSHAPHQSRSTCCPHWRWFHGGVGKRGWLGASSSGHTIARLPSCHWNSTSLCAICMPLPSTRKGPKTVL